MCRFVLLKACATMALLLLTPAVADDASGVAEPTRHEPDLRSSTALVYDQGNQQVLYAKNSDISQPIASITKLMTAMVVLDAEQPLDDRILVSPRDVDRLKYTHSRLRIGMNLSRLELLSLALIASENRAAAALARSYPGAEPECVRAMNRKARELGMYGTVFVDGTGLSPGNRSTPEDLVKLVDAAYVHPLIRRISTTPSYLIPIGKRGKRKMVFSNTNRLLLDGDWTIGVSKTGFIAESGHCLVMQARIAGERVVIVLLDGEGNSTRFGDARRIRQWIENNQGQLGLRLAARNRNA
jgi:serine-type D-Ala-D-Ala endopeptidase (penicillin-binding protein 7)